MSFTLEKRNRIKEYLMEKIFNGQDDLVKKTAQTFDVSTTTVYKYLSDMQKENQIKKTESGRYKLVNKIERSFPIRLDQQLLQEDQVYRETIEAYVKDLPGNVVKIWEYAFMEMFNNVIDHSAAKRAVVYIGQNELYTWVNIQDDGIGIFEKIREYYHYGSLDDAILSLFKGKLTTDKENHSGEGIFFTSRVMDHFAAISDHKIFSQDNMLEILKEWGGEANLDKNGEQKGTRITMALSNKTTKTLKEIFDRYSSVEGGFTVTSFPVKYVCDSGYPVSRSQAKRLYFGFEKFKTVILDFTDVEDMGQGFAHELFCVFQRKNPEIEIKCINTNESIDKMIYHVTGGQ